MSSAYIHSDLGGRCGEATEADGESVGAGTGDLGLAPVRKRVQLRIDGKSQGQIGVASSQGAVQQAGVQLE